HSKAQLRASRLEAVAAGIHPAPRFLSRSTLTGSCHQHESRRSSQNPHRTATRVLLQAPTFYGEFDLGCGSDTNPSRKRDLTLIFTIATGKSVVDAAITSLVRGIHLGCNNLRHLRQVAGANSNATGGFPSLHNPVTGGSQRGRGSVRTDRGRDLGAVETAHLEHRTLQLSSRWFCARCDLVRGVPGNSELPRQPAPHRPSRIPQIYGVRAALERTRRRRECPGGPHIGQICQWSTWGFCTPRR